VAIPHPEKPGVPSSSSEPALNAVKWQVLAVDSGKNLTLAAKHRPETLAAVRLVPGLNRFIDLRLEFIPGVLEASAFDLLANVVSQAISDVQQREPEPRNRLILLTLLELQATLGQALHQALTAVSAREETPYIEHDFIAHGLQARLAMAGEEMKL